MNLFFKSTLAASLLLSPVVISHSEASAKTVYKYVDKKSTLKYTSQKETSNKLSVGYSKLIKSGKNGYKIKRYKQTIKDGKVVKTTYVKTIKNVAPIKKVYQVGSKALPKIPKTKFHDDIQNGIYSMEGVSPTSGLQVGYVFPSKGVVTNIDAAFNEDYITMSKASSDIKYDKAKNGEFNFYYRTSYEGDLNITRSIPVNYATVKAFNENQFFSNKVFNDEIIKLVNEERKKKGIAPIKYNKHILNGASIRAMEMANAGKFVDGHLRTDGSGRSFNTVFEPEIKPYITTENAYFEGTTHNPYELVSEKFVAESAFTWWKNSPVHYQAMMNPNNKSVATAVKLGSKIRETYTRDTLYAAMIFSNK